MNIRLLLLPVGLVLLVVVAVAYFSFSVSRPNYSSGKLDETTVDFIVKPGEQVYEIAQALKKADLINSSILFKIYVRLNNLSGQLQAGNYRIARNLSLVEVVELLRHGTFDVRLTFPEGWRREQMAEYVAKSFNGQNPNFSSEDFLEKSASLEGYLFPDTYVVPFDIKAIDLISLMKRTFEKKVVSQLGSNLNYQTLTLEEATILASIVERESSDEKDRPVVAGILIKRWKSGWALEADATVQYALASQSGVGGGDWWPKELSIDDLQINSAYNTRKHPGLPPGPISNPGFLSMQAVVYSLETPYWFYLTDDSGLTHYAKTLEEHESNIAKYLH